MIPLELVILILALILDLVLGEPPSRVHPVVWMGRLLAAGERLVPQRPGGQLLAGFGLVTLTALLFAGLAALVLAWARVLDTWIYVLVGVLMLKPMFAVRELFRAARSVLLPLEKLRLDEARLALRALVSRDTGTLGPAAIGAAVIESLAENVNDSFIAPTFYFLLFGVPGAVFYRVINTADAMFGYRGRYEYLGKFAARLDDLLNIIPARLTALLIILAALLLGREAGGAWRVMRRDRRRTPSPNGGWPMSAMAGALGVELAKAGEYLLGAGGRAPGVSEVAAAARITAVTAGLWLVVLMGVGLMRDGWLEKLL